MAELSNWQIYGPALLQGIAGALTAWGVYQGTKWLANRNHREERFRKVYAPILEDVVLYLRYHMLWRDHNMTYNPQAVCDHILHHVKEHLGDFGHRVVSAYLSSCQDQVHSSGRGGVRSPVPIFWHIVEEAYDLIKDHSSYEASFKNELQGWRSQYFIWAMLGDGVVRWSWDIHFQDLSLSYDDLVRRYGAHTLVWCDEPSSNVPECFVKEVIPNSQQAEQVLAFCRGEAKSPSLLSE